MFEYIIFILILIFIYNLIINYRHSKRVGKELEFQKKVIDQLSKKNYEIMEELKKYK